MDTVSRIIITIPEPDVLDVGLKCECDTCVYNRKVYASGKAPLQQKAKPTMRAKLAKLAKLVNDFRAIVKE